MNEEAKKLIAAELNRLAKKGRITPKAVVDAARDPSSPLHEHFEWNDSEAAELYRQEQARTLLRSVNFTVRVKGRKIAIPRYVRDPDCAPREPGYRDVSRIRSEADAAREVLIEEFSRAAGMLGRARKLAAYFDMVAEVDELTDSLHALTNKLAPSRTHI